MPQCTLKQPKYGEKRHKRLLLSPVQLVLLLYSSPALNVNKVSPAVQYVWFGWHWGQGRSLMRKGHQANKNTCFGASRIGVLVLHEKLKI